MKSLISWVHVLIYISSCYSLDPYDFSKSYFCSTCFTNNQDQNYHCCFYFFKCCAEARRGSKSTTLKPRYPPIPTQIAYIVQDTSGQPCSPSCPGPSALCCGISHPGQGSQAQSTVSYLRAEQEFEGYVEADTMVKNPMEEEDETSDAFTKQWSTPNKLVTTDKQTQLALGSNSRISNLDPRHNDFSKKLFIPPSLASGHESYDSSSQSSRKLGWVTKDLLKLANGETRK